MTEFRIDDLFREYGIEIAFPQRDLHIRSASAAIPIHSTQIVDGEWQSVIKNP